MRPQFGQMQIGHIDKLRVARLVDYPGRVASGYAS
jgi:hypothetical protein